MGDRGNIIVKDGASEVFLYTHWRGSDLPEILKSALKRGKERWTDGQYLARIIFDEMTRGQVGELTGFGISSVIGDGGTDITVNVDNQTVRCDDEPTYRFEDYANRPPDDDEEDEAA